MNASCGGSGISEMNTSNNDNNQISKKTRKQLRPEQVIFFRNINLLLLGFYIN